MRRLIQFILAFTFSNFSLAQISVTFTNVVQPCTNNGSATAVVTGGTPPYSYAWQHPSTGLIVSTSSVLTSANPETYGYVVNVRDANNVLGAGGIYLRGVISFLGDTVNWSGPPMMADYVTSNAICPSYNNGALTYTIATGNAPFNYSTSTGSNGTTSASTFSVGNLSPGTYSCFVTDNAGCFNSFKGIVVSVPGFSVNTTTTPDTCSGNGSATAIPVSTGGGTAPFTYLWNSTPPQTTPTLSGISVDWTAGGSGYVVNVTDANGCAATGWAWIKDSITLYSMQSYANIKDATCGQTNGYISITNYGGNPPYTYLWNTGATMDSIYNLSPGIYTVTVNDAAGCHETFVKHVHSISPVYANGNKTNALCNNTGGADTLAVYGGTPPYTFLWNTGATTPYITNVPSGWYWVNILDANNCPAGVLDSISLQPNCISYITGTTYNDMNGNCTLDFNESILPQQIFQASNGFIYWSDWNGNFSIPIINPSGTYTVTQTPKSPWTQICPVSSFTLSPVGGTTYSNNSYYDQPNPIVNDLRVQIVSDSCRPGFTFNQYVYVFNNGTSTITGSTTLKINSILNVINTGSATSYNSATNTFTFNFTDLPPLEWAWFYVQLQAPSNTTLFTPLTSYAVANPITGDATPNNNYDTLHYRVTGSYDPNEKAVTPKGTGPSGNISTTDSILTYNIHFQNTGTYPTSFISIIDTLDPNLDVFSLKILSSFAIGNYNLPTVSFLSNNVVKFSYNYCQLQPASVDLLNSSGYLTYSIQQKKNLSVGSQIKNRANIYFDYNTAILTNTTLNTIATIGVDDIANQEKDFLIYPNPGNDVVTLKHGTKKSEVKIIDVIGNVVKQLRTETEETNINFSELPNGVYLIQLKDNDNSSIKKIVIQH